jgi:metallo-beta-lactamase family protein
MLAITFHGAARTTTGSMHLVEANGLRLLLDCGLYQGHRKEAFERNRNLPVDPATLDAVILSHAHIDHSGNLPTLARQGFRGKVVCTPATADLCEIMLRDSAFLQAQDLKFVNKRRRAQGKHLFEPLYEEPDVDRILRRFQPAPLGQAVDLGRGVAVTLNEAGHILGSATVLLEARPASGQTHRLLFSGDLGNPGQPILRPPAFVEGANTLLIESTYADRDHPPLEDVTGRLKGFIEDIHQQHAKLIIPAFSVGRTQQILFLLNHLVEQRRVPSTPVFVDSPLATRATAIYARHPECYNEKAAAMLKAGDDPFRFPGLHFTGSVEESMALNDRKGPFIIISASGMCEGGRIVHHLRNNIQDPRNIVLIVGFQAEHTLGRRIVDREPVVRIFGEPVPLEARVHTINALSAHADRRGLMSWFTGVQSPALRQVFALHGDAAQTDAMVELLQAHGARQALAPVPGQRIVLEQ